MNNTRARAARVLQALMQQKGSLATQLRADDDALTRELCFGTCRWFHLLQPCLQALMSKPLKSKDDDVRALLLIGLYQLLFMRIPAHAAVNETVDATKALKKPWARQLVNGVLRNFQRQQTQLLEQTHKQPEATHSHPAWLLQAIRAAWPDHWQAIVTANNQHPPMTLRNNSARQDRGTCLQQLQAAGMPASPGRLSEDAIYLDQAVDARSLPGFAQGSVSVQDEASQMVPGLLHLAPRLRVLDACAAPGGKTTHMLERFPDLKVLALDLESRRIARITENLQRLQLTADVRCADAADPAQWWDGVAFDRILLDAPCSATGIIRRQPDIKLLRQPDDVQRLIAVQQSLLDALWTCLAPGGMLLYTTCSILPAENREQIASFVERHPDARAGTIDVDWGLDVTPGRQLLPEEGGTDGFYFAQLHKLDPCVLAK